MGEGERDEAAEENAEHDESVCACGEMGGREDEGCQTGAEDAEDFKHGEAHFLRRATVVDLDSRLVDFFVRGLLR